MLLPSHDVKISCYSHHDVKIRCYPGEVRFYSTSHLFFANARMNLSNKSTQEETLLTPRNQEMVVGQKLQSPPNHLFSDNSELLFGVSPHTRWLATIREQNAQLVTARGSPTDYSPRNQEMVVGQNLQLSPNHLFSDNNELAVGVSPPTRWLATIREQNAQLVTARGSPTDYSPRNQEMVVGQNLQLSPNHLFSDNNELVVGVSPPTRWLATIREQNAQLVTARGSPTDYSPRNQEMVVGQNLQLSPNHLFSDNNELVVGVSPPTRWLATIREQNAQLVTGRQRGSAP